MSDPFLTVLESISDPTKRAEMARRKAEYEATRTDPWRWYCRICGETGEEETAASQQEAAFEHLDTAPHPRKPNLGIAVAGHLLHVWSY